MTNKTTGQLRKEYCAACEIQPSGGAQRQAAFLAYVARLNQNSRYKGERT